MVLPAPVSPVTTVKPGDSSSTASSMTPSPVIRTSSSMTASRLLCRRPRLSPRARPLSRPSPRQPATGRPNLATSRSVNGGAAFVAIDSAAVQQPGQQDRERATPDFYPCAGF